MHTTHDARDWSQMIAVALDVATEKEAIAILDQLAGYNIWIKIGNQLGTAIGWNAAINLAHDRGFSIFCDTKYKDIPETVKQSSSAITRLGADMFNVMADTSSVTLDAAKIGRDTAADEVKLVHPKLIGVTVLTSLSDEECHSIYGASSRDKVMEFATRTATAGLDGVVCSAEEAVVLRNTELTRDLFLVTPGIRPEWSIAGDQSRIVTPKQAILNGSDMVVIGRPITQPPANIGTPKDALEKIIAEIKE